jgi:hypothetical protein
MNKEITELVKRLEAEISNTPTGELRNLLCDANITIQALNIPSVIHCTDLEPEFVNALNQLVKTQRQPTKKRF